MAAAGGHDPPSSVIGCRPRGRRPGAARRPRAPGPRQHQPGQGRVNSTAAVLVFRRARAGGGSGVGRGRQAGRALGTSSDARPADRERRAARGHAAEAGREARRPDSEAEGLGHGHRRARRARPAGREGQGAAAKGEPSPNGVPERAGPPARGRPDPRAVNRAPTARRLTPRDAAAAFCVAYQELNNQYPMRSISIECNTKQRSRGVDPSLTIIRVRVACLHHGNRVPGGGAPGADGGPGRAPPLPQRRRPSESASERTGAGTRTRGRARAWDCRRPHPFGRRSIDPGLLV